MNKEKLERKRFLLKTTEEYLEALVSNDPARVNVSSDVKITFNGEKSELGKSLIWENTLIIPQRQTFADPDSGNIVFFGVVSNDVTRRSFESSANDLFAMTHPYALRLHVTDNLIDEIEEMYVECKYCGFPTQFTDIHLPDLFFDMPVPEDERSSREELISAANAYWDSLSRAIDVKTLPCHPDVDRIENGSKITNLTTSFHKEFEVPTFCWDTPKAERRFPVVDVARGLVVSMQVFLTKKGPGFDGMPGSSSPGFFAVEAFRVEDGLIRHVSAFWRHMQVKSGWGI